MVDRCRYCALSFYKQFLVAEVHTEPVDSANISYA